MDIEYIDVHAHLSEKIFDKDRKEILDKCAEQGILVVSCTGKPEDNKKALKIKHPNLKFCIGVYPLETIKMSHEEFFKELKFIEDNSDKIVGIGEVGLDYYWEKDEKKQALQRERFMEIIWLANKLKLMLNVHTRNAEKDAVDMLLKHAKVPVLLHSYGGDIEIARPAIKAGYMFSVAPILVRSNKHKKLVKELPLQNLVSETDCPYLGPTSERNDPTNIPIVIEEIAKIKVIDKEKVRATMLSNAKKLFNF